MKSIKNFKLNEGWLASYIMSLHLMTIDIEKEMPDKFSLYLLLMCNDRHFVSTMGKFGVKLVFSASGGVR